MGSGVVLSTLSPYLMLGVTRERDQVQVFKSFVCFRLKKKVVVLQLAYTVSFNYLSAVILAFLERHTSTRNEMPMHGRKMFDPGAIDERFFSVQSSK